MTRDSLPRMLAVLSAGLLAMACLTTRGRSWHEGPGVPDDPLPAGARLRLGGGRLQHGGPVLGLVFSSDGKVLASAARDHTVRLWDLPAGRERLRLRHEWVCRVAVSPDGKLLASAGDEGTLRLWETRTGKLVRRLGGHPAAVLCLAFSPDGRTLLSGSADHTARLWDVAGGRELLRLARNEGPVNGVLFAARGDLLVTAGKGIRLWKTTGELVRSFAEGEAVSCLALAPDGKSLAASDGSAIRLWDPATGRGRTLRKGGTSVAALAFGPSGETLVSSEADGTLRLWRVATGKELRASRRAGDGDRAAALALSPDGKTIAAAGAGNDIELRETATDKLLPPGGEKPARVVAFACSADGKRLATGSPEGPVCLWDVLSQDTGRERGRLGQDGAGGVAVALSADGKTLAACGEDGAVRLWDAEARKEIRALPARPKGKPRHLRFSPDGKVLAVGFTGRDGDVVQLFDVPSGKARHELSVTAELAGMAFSPDGKLLATTGAGGVRTWDVARGTRVREYGTSAGGGLAFAPNGRLLAVAGSDGVISLFEVATGEALRHLAGHDSVHALAFSPDGLLLASGGGDALVAVWEVATGRALRRFPGHTGPVRFVAFRLDGRGVLSAGDDATALLWDVTGRAPGGARPGPPSATELRQLWEDLARLEPERAYRAVWRLADHPDQSVGLLYDGLKPVLGIDARRIEQLIVQLDHNRFTMREKASDALQSLGDVAAPALRRALAKTTSPEARRRIKELLGRLKNDPLVAERERVRRLRSLAALEQGGTGPARKVLREVAKGAADEELRQAAREALRRLAGPGS